jgi:hypothetical protein
MEIIVRKCSARAILLLFFAYPLNDGAMILAGWGLVILGTLVYILEIVLSRGSS